jgi:hypothetical protein
MAGLVEALAEGKLNIEPLLLAEIDIVAAMVNRELNAHRVHLAKMRELHESGESRNGRRRVTDVDISALEVRQGRLERLAEVFGEARGGNVSVQVVSAA